jgi:cystathionine beta-lyase/cystathionine gamma-synthase
VRFDTRLVHAGQEVEQGTGDVVPPVHLSTTYDQTVQDPARYFYGRGENPTRQRLERCLAALEDARHALVFASGQAAGATALSLLAPGQRLLASADLYGGTRQLFAMLERYGIAVVYADLTDATTLDRVLGADVGLVWVETPSNPLLEVADIAGLGRRCSAAGVPLLVDNTFAGPALQQPLRHGARISLYSTTKFIAGHADVLGGALVYDDDELHEQFGVHRSTTGAVPGPWDCFLVHRGVKTLALRVARQVANAQALVAALSAEPAVTTVRYPGLDHGRAALVRRQMAAPGAVVSFTTTTDPSLVLSRVQLFAPAVSLGGVRSLIEHPATMTHRTVPSADRSRLGVTDDLIRISPGIEDPADLVEDLLMALTCDRTPPGR